MKSNIRKIKIIFLIFLSLSITSCQNYFQNNTNSLDNRKKNFQVKGRKERMSKRKLDGINDDDYIPYHIYLDLLNFEKTIPNTLKNYKNIIISSMEKAKETLQSLIQIYDYHLVQIFIDLQKLTDKDINFYDGSIFQLFEGDTDMLHLKENIHLVIFFKFSDSTLVEDGVASAQIILNNPYPQMGIITLSKNFPPSKLTSSYLEPLMLHLFTHIMGFYIEEGVHELDIDIQTIYEEDNKFYIGDSDPGSDNIKVINYARKYFGDLEINKIEISIDENGNIHWPSRHFLGEYMTPFNYPEELAISGFTLAFLEDLGHYKANYYTGGLMRFGKHKGNNFLTKGCENDGIKFKNEFYYPSTISDSITEPSCSSGRQSKTVYKLTSYEEEIPEEYRYFGSDSLGGFASADYCPVSQSNSANKNTDKCSETSNVANAAIGESFSSISFCALSSLIKKSSTLEEVFRAGCFEMYCSEKSLTIKVGQEYFVCPREGGKISEETNYKGYLLCPDFNLICTANVTCNNMFDCVQKKSVEYEIEYDYNTIETTQISSEYDNNENVKVGWELADNGKSKCPQYCSQCNINGNCLKCGTNYKLSDNKCIEKVPNCQTYDSDGNCEECKTDYTFVDGNKTICLKKSDLGNQYFPDTTDSKNYIKCSTAISNCDRCTNADACTKCLDNYAIIDESHPTECVDISSNEYYLDENQKYKKCSTVSSLGNCKKCLKNNDIINCIECEENNSLVHKDTDTCVLKSVIENENHDDLFTDDDGLNYYLCSNSLYHSVEHCLKCNNKELCNSCQKDYEITNSNTLCMLKSDTLSQRYYKDPNDNNFYLCSDKIKGCDKCTDGNTCISCKEDFDLNENNKCVHISILMLKYYFDPDIGKYISCSKIENCEECTSKTECTKCQNGYQMKEGDNICEKSNDSKLMSLVRAAVALSTIAVVLSIIILLLILYNKFFSKSSPREIDTVPGNEDNENGVVIQTTKRSIKNN